MAKKIKVTQIRDGKRVTFLTPDKGKPGKTPKEEQWYEPSGVETGWKKDMPEGERRRLVLKAHKGDELSSARSMQAKVNVTTDGETKQKAKADAQYFFKRHRIGKRPVTSRPRVKKVVKEKVPAVPELGNLKTIPEMGVTPEVNKLYPEFVKLRQKLGTAIDRMGEIQEAGGSGARYASIRDKTELELIDLQYKIAKEHPELAYREIAKPPVVEEVKPRLGTLQRLHARRSTQARIRDEQQTHQVTIEVDSPRVKVWLKDPSAADIKGIDTPRARRRKSPRITPPTPKLRR